MRLGDPDRKLVVTVPTRHRIIVTLHHGVSDDEVAEVIRQLEKASPWIRGVIETTDVTMSTDDDPGRRVRRSDPVTSQIAAQTQTPRKMTEARQRLMTLIEGASPRPLSDHELLDMWTRRWGPIAASGPRTRRCELVEMGLVVKVDENGRSPSGMACSRWTIVSPHHPS